MRAYRRQECSAHTREVFALFGMRVLSLVCLDRSLLISMWDSPLNGLRYWQVCLDKLDNQAGVDNALEQEKLEARKMFDCEACRITSIDYINIQNSIPRVMCHLSLVSFLSHSPLHSSMDKVSARRMKSMPADVSRASDSVVGICKPDESELRSVLRF
jgi:hypothetical protein